MEGGGVEIDVAPRTANRAQKARPLWQETRREEEEEEEEEEERGGAEEATPEEEVAGEERVALGR